MNVHIVTRSVRSLHSLEAPLTVVLRNRRNDSTRQYGLEHGDSGRVGRLNNRWVSGSSQKPQNGGLLTCVTPNEFLTRNKEKTLPSIESSTQKSRRTNGSFAGPAVFMNIYVAASRRRAGQSGPSRQAREWRVLG
jgi:hypothetical protein